MTFKLFGYYINIFKKSKSEPHPRSFQLRRSGKYLFLCDSNGWTVPMQKDMIICNRLNEHDTCWVTFEFVIDLTHLDEEPIQWPSDERAQEGQPTQTNSL